MDAVLDANFLINLVHLDRLQLIRAVSKDLDWHFIMPDAVFWELNEKEVKALSSLPNDAIPIHARIDIQDSRIKRRLKGLGSGEREAIGIVSRCNDKTFKNYVIVTDDKQARNRACKLGMNTMGTLDFLIITNNEDMLSRHDAIQAVDILKKNRYFIAQSEMEKFMKKLI